MKTKHLKLANEKGITLIALVVTIIILIILATVSINLIFREGGLIDTAQRARTIQRIADYRDKIDLAKATVAATNEGNIPINKLKEELESQGMTVVEENGGLTVKGEDGIEITITPTLDGKDVVVTYPEAIGGGESSNPQNPEETVTKEITLKQSNETISATGTVTLQAEVSPSDATVIWTSSDSNIATVDNGVVTAKGIGEVTITATIEGTTKTASCKVTVADYIGNVIGNPVSKNQTVLDKYENKIVIPEGFKVVANGTSNVTYTYTGDNIPSVQDGIVIQDSEGNQFVWIPVGTIKNKNTDSNGTTTDIILGRYTFDEGDLDTTNNVYDGTGEAELVQAAEDYKSLVPIDERSYELETSSFDNITAYNLGEFVENTLINKGYYMARYEASYRDGTKPYSMQSEGTAITENDYTGNYTWQAKQLWNCINQETASNASRAMYTSQSFRSDLTNSYAFDTALVFLATYTSEKNIAIKTGPETQTIVNTGTTAEDKLCNIYDLQFNCVEWTTETYDISEGNWVGPCIYRGAAKWLGVGARICYDQIVSGNNTREPSFGFRPIIYTFNK